MNRFDVKNIKQRKTTKVIKLRWSAWIRRQNEQKCWVTSQTIQNNANLQRLSKYNELHRFDVKTIKYVELRPKPFQTQQNYKSDQITMNWIDLTSKRSKMLSYVPNHSKHSKTTKVIKLRWSAWIWRQNEQKCWVSRKPFKTTQMYKGYQSTMNCIDLTLKRSKMFSYVPNHSKQLKPTKVIKLQWIASIWCQKHQTTQNYKSDQITRKCMDLTSKRTKMLSYVPNHSKQRKSTKFIKVQWIASIWCQKHQTTQNYKSDQITMNCIDLMSKTSNNAKLQKWSNYDELHRFDVKTIKNVELRPKPFKTTQTYKSNQIAMNWIDLMSKTSNNAKLQKWSNYDEVHGLDVKTNKNVELRRKPFKTTQIYKGYQSTMNCIDLMSKTSNNAKLQKWSNYDELHRFDVKTIKNVELRPKPFQTQQNYKSDQITMNWIDLTSKR